MAIRLLDTANKVPSFCPEQEFTPEASEFRSPVGVGCQRTTSQSSSSPGKTLGRGPAFCSCLPHSSLGLPEWCALAEKAILEETSFEHQGRNSESAIPRGAPIPETRHPQDSGVPQGSYLGNHLAC